MKTLFFIFITFFALRAYAACVSPSGSKGDITWNSSEISIKWCNGDVWVNPIVSPGLSCTSESPGKIASNSGLIQFCDGTFWQSMKGNVLNECLGDIPGMFRWDESRQLMKFCDGIYWNAMYQAGAPAVTSIRINSGAGATRLNNLVMELAANSSEAYSKITHFCFKHSPSGVVPTAPDVNDACWSAVNFPSPGISPANTISFSNFFYSIGFTPATYTLYGWIKNGADVISSLSNSGDGTFGTDKASIIFDPGAPPEFLNVFATNSNTSSVPPQPTDLTTPAGTHVFIKWKLTDDQVLPSSPIELSYTTDEVNYQPIISGLSNTAHSGCTVDGVVFTGCYLWTNGSPSNGYFKIRIKAVDDAGLSAIASAEPNNMSTFKILAGTTDPGLGGSAASAVIYSPPYSVSETAAGNFVVRDNGSMYFADDRGLMVVDPNDGNMKLFIRYAGTQIDGPLASATIRGKPSRLALDYQDRLLIIDYDRIRRFDFTTNQLSTFIGGGSSTADGVSATGYQFVPFSWHGGRHIFNPLPNGDIWFQSGDDMGGFLRSSGKNKIRIYKAADNKIYTLNLSGTGSRENPGFDPDPYQIYNMGISFNPLTSEVTRIRSRSIVPVPGGHTPYSVSYSPTTGQTITPHIPYLAYWADDTTITSRKGEMYVIDRFSENGFYKYNTSTHSWDRIIGNGQSGQCPDGTLATQCPADMTDAFVTSQDQIFVMDRGRIRTIDNNGRMLTLFGQQLTFGDGDLAVNARINNTEYIDLSNNGKIVIVDNIEHVIREFTPDGTIERLAGNGLDAGANVTDPANIQPISTSYWGGFYAMSVDSTDGTVYFPRQGSFLSKLDRSTGRWVDIAGFGPTTYAEADGLTGDQVMFDGYNQGVLGFNGSVALRQFHRWNGTFSQDFFIKAYDKTTGTQSTLAGQTGPQTVGSIDECASGVALTACGLPSNHNTLSKAQWDATNSRWYIHQVGSNLIRIMNPGGNWGTLINLPRGAWSYTYTVKPSGPHVYYCATDNRMYKYDLTNSSETALTWPSSSIICYGKSLVYHPTRQSIIFPMKQNGLGAIGEIKDP